MPTRSKKPCGKAGCPALTDTRYCSAHTTETPLYDKWRGSSTSRGYDNNWSKIRVIALKRDNYLCLSCLSEERITVAVDVDHVIPIDRAPLLRLTLSNLQSLCRACHVMKTKRERRFGTP